MPYKVIYEENGKIIKTIYYGKLQSAEIYQSFNDKYSDLRKLIDCQFIISDFTEVSEILCSDIDMARLARIHLAASDCKPDIIAIGIMPTDHGFALGRMWQGNAFDVPWRTKIVRTREEATEWLKEIKK